MRVPMCMLVSKSFLILLLCYVTEAISFPAIQKRLFKRGNTNIINDGIDNGEQRQNLHDNLNSSVAGVTSIADVGTSTTKEQMILLDPIENAVPTFEQQKQIVFEYVNNNPDLKAVLEKLKKRSKECERNSSLSLKKLLSNVDNKAFSDAMAYLGQVAGSQLSTTAVAKGLGLSPRTVARNWKSQNIEHSRARYGKKCKKWPEWKLQQILLAVEEDAQNEEQTSYHEAETPLHAGARSQTQITGEKRAFYADWPSAAAPGPSNTGEEVSSKRTKGVTDEDEPSVPDFEQQMRVVNAYIQKNGKLQVAMFNLRNIRGDGTNISTTFKKYPDCRGRQIFYDAITYLGQVSDGILGSQVIADALGINNTTVKRYWNIRGLKNLRTKNSKSTRHYKIIEMEKILKTVREDAKRHTGNANRKPLLESAPCDRQFPGPSASSKLRLFGVDIDLPAGQSDMQQQETPQSQQKQQQVEAVQPFPLVQMSHRQPIVAPQSIATTTNTEAGTAETMLSIDVQNAIIAAHIHGNPELQTIIVRAKKGKGKVSDGNEENAVGSANADDEAKTLSEAIVQLGRVNGQLGKETVANALGIDVEKVRQEWEHHGIIKTSF